MSLLKIHIGVVVGASIGFIVGSSVDDDVIVGEVVMDVVNVIDKSSVGEEVGAVLEPQRLRFKAYTTWLLYLLYLILALSDDRCLNILSPVVDVVNKFDITK